jgi:transposase InsO family protein
VLDLGSRKLLGYAMAEHMRAELVVDAITMAALQNDLAGGAIFHSDYAEVLVKPRDRGFACVGGVS